MPENRNQATNNTRASNGKPPPSDARYAPPGSAGTTYIVGNQPTQRHPDSTPIWSEGGHPGGGGAGLGTTSHWQARHQGVYYGSDMVDRIIRRRG
jgi:hypothetical protein